MHNLFDKIFSNHVQEVFNNHQETYNPADWEKLRTKIGAKKKGLVFFLPYIAKAASIVILFGVSVFVANKYAVTGTVQANGKPVSNNHNNFNSGKKRTAVNFPAENIVQVNKIKYQNSATKVQVANNEQNNTITDSLSQDNQLLEKDSTVYAYNNSNRFNNLKNVLNAHHHKIKSMDSARHYSNKPMLTEDNAEFAVIEDKSKEKNRFDFGIELASVSNYSTQGNSSGLNVGGGFSAAYRVSKNISFTTGALIAKQSINYTGSRGGDKFYADAYKAPADNSLSIIDVGKAESEVQFVAIDIPLNVQFKHKRMSFTTGFSSLLYVQEKYTYSYNAYLTNTVYNQETFQYDTYASVETVSNEENSDSFNRFDFARLLNLSVGYDIPLTKGMMVLEPYVKYPLGNISSKEIFMGSGGFAIRYIF
ncbi:MAG: hypothetical protein P1P88_24440 [Bacteroidales bacterium]|nr:hypothetical protein [Bacteroidales bacterium]